MEPIKILYTIPNFMTAGTGRIMLNIIERLNRDEFAPSICVLKRGGDLEAIIEGQGIPLLELPYTIPHEPFRTLPGRVRQAAAHFRPYGFDVFHSFDYSSSFTEPLIARASGAKWIYTKKNMSWGNRAWVLRSLLASRIFTVNKVMQGQFFTNPIFSRKVRYSPRGLVVDRFQPGAPRRLFLREQFNIPEDAFVIGSIANVIPRKGYHTLLDALKLVADPNIHLLIGGDLLEPDYHQKLLQQAQDLNLAHRVHFAGFIKDVPGFHAEVDLFVLSTHDEAFGNAAMEAMASAVPTIATHTPGPEEVIIHGQNGLLVPVRDPNALAAAINLLLHNADLRDQLAKAGRRHVEQFCSVEAEVARHETIYRELFKRQRMAA